MKAIFDPAFTISIGLEGGYTNNPEDVGGPTNWGITQAEARAHGYMGDMKDLPIETAKLIDKSDYWNSLMLDWCDDQAVANKMFDGAINCGVNTMAGWVQEALNALGHADGIQEPKWPVLAVDKQFGLDSMAALNICLGVSPKYTQVLLETINCLQGAAYVHDTENNPHLRAFFLGWVANRVSL